MDCVFIAILSIRIQNENINTAITSINKEFERPMSANATFSSINDTIKGFLLSNFATNQPESGKPNNELIGNVNNTFPNSASFKLNKSLMVGILAAQVAKQKPESRKNRLKEMRCL